MKDTGKINEARFALLVSGDDLPMEEITAMLGLNPVRTVRKGDLLNRLPEILATEDEWVYIAPLSDPLGVDHILEDILDHLNRHAEVLPRLQQMGKLTLRLSVQSDSAQMLYRFTPGTLRLLAELNTPLEVSSLSWGEIGL